MASGATALPVEVGYFRPRLTAGKTLQTGEVGYVATGLKDVRFAKVGDTVTTQNPEQKTADTTPLSGYKEPKPMVYLGLFPISSDELGAAREAMEKLRLADSAFTFQPISSIALGNGFQCGFLGLLHAEVVQERLVNEFGLTLFATAPTVSYQVRTRGRSEFEDIHSAAEFPDPAVIDEVREPVMQVTIYAPSRFVGAIMQLAQEKRAEYVDLAYKADQAVFTYAIPLSEMIIDFFDRLKSITEGYASLDYEYYEHQTVDVVKVDILVNKERVDAFATLMVREHAESRGRMLAERLAEAIPKQQFEVPIQAAIGGKVIARADVKAYRKDVTAKLYGGDRTRKDKLLKKQKKGKAKMKLIGRVEIPQSAFFSVLKRD